MQNWQPNLLLPLSLGHGTYSSVAPNSRECVNLLQKKCKIWKNKLSFIRNSLEGNSGRRVFLMVCEVLRAEAECAGMKCDQISNTSTAAAICTFASNV